MDVKILHLSDLHLGNDLLFRSLWHCRWPWKKIEDPQILSALENAIREAAPTYVLVTGDIVNKCTKRSFRHAASVLRSVCTNSGVDAKKRLLIIPGNHDVKTRRYQHEYFGRVFQFVCFLKLLFDEKDFLSRKARFVRVDADRRLCFFCLDSTLKNSFQLAEGEVGAAQWDWFTRKSEQLAKTYSNFEQFVKIVAVHHHPEAITGSGGERFMQLLDAGEALVRFDRAGINLVLHGHKHFPHETTRNLSGGRHYTIIGAGTATCPIPAEQAGEGNNFNVLKIRPNANLLEVQRWKINNERRFVPQYDEPHRHALFTASESGYKMATSRTIARITDIQGSCVITHERLGLSVDKGGFELRNISFQWGTKSTVAEIADFDYDRQAILEARHELNEPRRRKGYFVFRAPLLWGTDPVDIWYTYEVRRAFCLERTTFGTFYPGNDSHLESVDISVPHPCDELSIVVEFPLRYAAAPWVRARDQNDTDLDLNQVVYTMRSDKLANRHALLVRQPKLNHRYGIWWEVTDG